MIRIENWSVVRGSISPYQAPETASQHLHGIVYNHSGFEDGTEITTSAISHVEDGCIVTRTGRIYELGAVDPVYEEAFPNARQRLLSQGA